MLLGWPQLTYLTLMILGIGMTAVKHGEAKSAEYNILTTLIVDAVMMFILYSGGFFGRHCS